MFYFHRFLRLSPALAVVIMIQATILKHMGNGPVWFMGKAFSQVCVDNWWSSLLYVQNYVNPNEQVCNNYPN